jgi:prepilin-type N-terminal cleavage/methylation domain-containing protein
MIKGRKKNSGFTLVELMIVVAIIGILAAVAIPAFSKYIKKSRTTESSGHLNKMWSGSVAYYETDHVTPAGGTLQKQFPVTAAAVEANCCTAVGNTGEKCPGNAAAYTTDPSWIALNFGMADPHYYVPKYTSQGTGGTSIFSAEANGNLDCDAYAVATVSTFRRTGYVNNSGDVYSSSGVYINNELE